MTMSFYCLNHPAQMLSYMNKHRSQFATRMDPALAVPPSVLLQTDDSGNLLDLKQNSGSNTSPTSSNSGGSLLSQDNTVGIIGGLSAKSTLKFLKKFVQWSSNDGEDCPPFVLCSDPVLSKELLSHEKSSSFSPVNKSKHFQMDHSQVVENLRHKRVFLEKSGASCIVMPCHISHSWHDEISRGSSVPVLHMGECVAKELKEAKLRPLEAGSPLRIGVLGTGATLKAGFYQQKLQNEGFEVVLPDKATMEHTVIPGIEALKRKDMEGAQNLVRISLQVLLLRAVSRVILASDCMLELLPPDDPLLKKCVDPMDALVRETIKLTQSGEKGT
ncbi:uncharacterized protein LOC127790310 [Diospyros lotus]|uniref:uncharacterized protein LOC127790310 n=1 Tax=Diospyros lotus TaxID=55363 RepID=UPI0022551C92|nr:uncharacterized protein LOC127790310 [Diospyros lotus]